MKSYSGADSGVGSKTALLGADLRERCENWVGERERGGGLCPLRFGVSLSLIGLPGIHGAEITTIGLVLESADPNIFKNNARAGPTID